MAMKNGVKNYVRGRWRCWLPAVATFVVIVTLYLATLQRTVNGSDHGYTLDTGEIQVALNTAGTVHYTGYPLYTILSTLVTIILRSLGVSPATAASFSSLLWSILALLLIYRLLLDLTEQAHPLAAGGVLLLAATETIWLHSIVAEVYSFSVLLTAAVLLLAARLAQHPGRRTWLLLMLVWGAATAHHRSLLLLFPALLLPAPALGPLLRRHPRWLLYGVLAFVLPFAAYLYLPLRAWQGASWIYGRPDTWQGFWEQFMGSEVTGRVLRLPGRGDVEANARFLLDQFREQLPLPLLLTGLAGLFWYARSRPWWAVGLLGIVLTVSAFVFLFPPAVWAPAVVLPAVVALVAGLVLLAQAVTDDRRARVLLAVLFLGAAAWLARSNWSFVHNLVTDPTGTEVIASLERLELAARDGEEPVVAIPWGTHYFAAAFGQLVEGRFPGLLLVDHRADFRRLASDNKQLLTPVFTLGYWPLDWWQNRLGPVHLDEAAPEFVQISPQGQSLETPPSSTPFDTGAGIKLWADVVAAGAETLLLTLWWQPVELVAIDYRVAVHLVRRDPPQDPADLLAQADVVHPIDGWYPTSRWQPGEVVRDSYLIPRPMIQSATVRVALYRQTEAGDFENSEWLSLPLP